MYNEQAYQKKYRAQHKGKIRAYNRAYRAKHERKIRRYLKTYRATHKRYFRSYFKVYYRKHRAQLLLWHKKYDAIHYTPERHSWTSMMQRCTNVRHHAFPSYGGRGITVCKRWQGKYGFETFLKDMGQRPEGRTLDRKNNNGNYTPRNCRWATPTQQNNNRRRKR